MGGAWGEKGAEFGEYLLDSPTFDLGSRDLTDETQGRENGKQGFFTKIVNPLELLKASEQVTSEILKGKGYQIGKDRRLSTPQASGTP